MLNTKKMNKNGESPQSITLQFDSQIQLGEKRKSALLTKNSLSSPQKRKKIQDSQFSLFNEPRHTYSVSLGGLPSHWIIRVTGLDGKQHKLVFSKAETVSIDRLKDILAQVCIYCLIFNFD